MFGSNFIAVNKGKKKNRAKLDKFNIPLISNKNTLIKKTICYNSIC